MNRLNTNKALHYALLCIAVLLSSCVNTLELVAPQGERRVMSHEVAVADAKAYFDTHFGQNTRSNDQTPTEEAPYAVGNLVPDWESGVTIANEHKTHTDFVAVMEGLMLGVARANNGTRTDVEILYFGGVGDTIIETAYTKDYSDHLGYNYVSGDVFYDYERLTAISENCDDYGKD